jgi:hypothetical protein
VINVLKRILCHLQHSSRDALRAPKALGFLGVPSLSAPALFWLITFDGDFHLFTCVTFLFFSAHLRGYLRKWVYWWFSQLTPEQEWAEPTTHTVLVMKFSPALLFNIFSPLQGATIITKARWENRSI